MITKIVICVCLFFVKICKFDINKEFGRNNTIDVFFHIFRYFVI